MPREPQSYGSNEEWVTGHTDQKVNNPKSSPAPEHREFYDERRATETSHDDQGGKTSDYQLAESAEPVGHAQSTEEAAPRVTTREGGAKRDSYFKKRDYE